MTQNPNKPTDPQRHAFRRVLFAERCGDPSPSIRHASVNYMTRRAMWNLGWVDQNDQLTPKGREVAVKAGIPEEIDATWGAEFGKRQRRSRRRH